MTRHPCSKYIRAGMLLIDNKNYFITTFWPFMILIPFLGSDRRVTYLSLVSYWFVAAARGECEGGNQEEEKFCLFHFAFMDTGERNSSRI